MYLLYIYSRHHDFRNMQWRVAKFIHEIHFVYVYYLIILMSYCLTVVLPEIWNILEIQKMKNCSKVHKICK